MRRMLIALLLALAGTSPAAADGGSRRAVDLDVPGALEALERSNLSHHEAIRRILAGIRDHPDAGVPRWMRASFDARDVRYAPVVLTSHPARRRLSFVLDTTRYAVTVVLTGVRGDVVPAR